MTSCEPQPDESMSERTIFLAALEIDDPVRRADYVDQACGEDATLRSEVEALLQSHDQASQFLETPVVAGDSLIDSTIPRRACAGDDDRNDEDSTGEAEFCRYW